MALRLLSARGLVGVLAVGLLAAGCNPDPGPSVSPTPSTGTTVASPSPTATENAEERKQREAFEAAEKAYRSAFAEVNRLSIEGGADEPTALLRKTATGNYLSAHMNQLSWLKESESRVSAAGTIGWVKPDSYSPGRVTLESCEDYRKVLIIDKSGKSTKPENVGTRVYRQQLTVNVARGLWQVSKLDTQEQLKDCAS